MEIFDLAFGLAFAVAFVGWFVDVFAVAFLGALAADEPAAWTGFTAIFAAVAAAT